MKPLRDPGWWTVAILILSFVGQVAAFRYLTEYRLAEIQNSLDRLEQKVTEQGRAVMEQDRRILRLEIEREQTAKDRHP